MPLRCFLPYMGLRKLHIHVLEGVPTAGKEIASFLVLQMDSLRHLTLWNIQLLAEGWWEAVLAAISTCEALQLVLFVLRGPEDADVRHHQEIGEILARIPDEDVLHFMNKGRINPFATRDWRSEPPIDSVFDAASEVSNVSDCSVWKGKGTDDLEDVDHDLDGPEYRLDYNTEPDTGIDTTSDASDLSDNDCATTF